MVDEEHARSTGTPAAGSTGGSTPKPTRARKPAAGAAAGKSAGVAAGKSAGRKSAARKSSARRVKNPQAAARLWAAQLDRRRPGLVPFVLDGLADVYGRPFWAPRLEPTSELILTILSANSADVNAEVAFARLRDRWPSAPTPAGASPDPRFMPGWGGVGIADLPEPNWAAIEAADLAELTEVIRPGGLANQKAPRIQTALRAISGGTGVYSLEFLRHGPPLKARDWLAQIPGIGKKTASVVLLFSFGMPLMPVDRHVFRVSQRIGLIPAKCDPDKAHDYFLAMLEPDQAYEMHVSLITHGRRMCHAQRPECADCPLASRCRFVNPKAV